MIRARRKSTRPAGTPGEGGARRGPRGGLAAAALLAGASAAAAADARRLDPLVITGTRTLQRLSETPVRTELLTAADWRLAAPRSVADAIELLPGARVENNCQNCGTSEILLLGLEQKFTQLLFDGAPLFSGLAGVYGIEQIPPVFLERIEVVKGGGSSVHGGGAVGGVINLIGRRPERNGVVAEMRGERVKGRPATSWSALADGVSADGRTAVSVFGQRARTEPVDLNGDGFSELTWRRLEVAGLRAVQRFAAGELRVDASQTDEFRRGGGRFDRPEPEADIAERVDTRRRAGGVTWSAAPGRPWELHAGAGVAVIDRGSYYGGLFGRGTDEALQPESLPGAGDRDQALLDRGYRTAGEVARDQFGFTANRLWHAEVQLNRRDGPHLTSVGAQHVREWVGDVAPVSPFVREYPVKRDEARGTNTGAFLQQDRALGGAWRLVAGLRADRNSELGEVVWSPRLNLRWSAGDELTLRATAATGFRAPQPFDEDLHIELLAGERARTVQAPDLRAEKARSLMLSADWQPAAAGGRLALEATVFHTRIRGMFTNSAVRTDPITGAAWRERFNGPDAAVAGVELNLGTVPVAGLRVDLGLVAQTARHREPLVLGVDDAGRVVAERDFLETPRRYAVGQLGWEAPGGFEMSVQTTYTGPVKAFNQRTGRLNARTRDFLVWNVGVARRVPWPGGVATFSAGWRNAFDARQRDLESGVDRDPYYFYGPRVPRTLHAGLRLEF